MEISNEMFVSCATYMVILFSGFVPEPEDQVNGGWIYICIFFMHIIWNMFFTLLEMARVAMLSVIKVYRIVKFKLSRNQRQPVEIT